MADLSSSDVSQCAGCAWASEGLVPDGCRQ